MTPLMPFPAHTRLIVNVASRCGYTPQYAGLEKLYRTYKDRGFVVLAYPCDQFGHQEPGTDEEIRRFCATTYDVTFPIFPKIDVKGPRADPLFTWLTSQKKGILGTAAIKWNFTKFLVSPDDRVLRRYGPADTPESIAADIEVSLTGRKIT